MEALALEKEYPIGLYNLVIPKVFAKSLSFAGQDGTYDVFSLVGNPDDAWVNDLIENIFVAAEKEIEHLRDILGNPDLNISQVRFVEDPGLLEARELSPGDRVAPLPLLERELGAVELGVVLEVTSIDGHAACLVRWLSGQESMVDTRLLKREELN